MQLQTQQLSNKISELNLYEIKRYITILEKLSLHELETEIKRNKIQSLCQSNSLFNEAILLTVMSKC
jgi:hypothetical protein